MIAEKTVQEGTCLQLDEDLPQGCDAFSIT